MLKILVATLVTGALLISWLVFTVNISDNPVPSDSALLKIPLLDRAFKRIHYGYDPTPEERAQAEEECLLRNGELNPCGSVHGSEPEVCYLVCEVE